MSNNMYDFLMRLPLLGWVFLCAMGQLTGLVQYMNTMNGLPIDFVYVIHLAMRFSTIAFLLLLAAAVILRSRPSTKASGLEPRVSALVGTLLVYGIALFPPARFITASRDDFDFPDYYWQPWGDCCTLTAWSLVQCDGRDPPARHIGPYHYVRHPLYLTEEIAVIGLFMQFWSAWTILLLVVQIAFQLRRMHNEEVVLTASFAEYVAYRKHTARLIPAIY